MNKQDKHIYTNLERKFIKGIDTFKCESNNCWITEKSCIARQKREVQMKNDPLRGYTEYTCSSCEVAVVMQKIHKENIKLHKATTKAKMDRKVICTRCNTEKVAKEGFLVKEDGKLVNRVCKDCLNKEAREQRILTSIPKDNRKDRVEKRNKKIEEYFDINPDSTQKQCADALGINHNQVYQYFRRIRDKEKETA